MPPGMPSQQDIDTAAAVMGEKRSRSWLATRPAMTRSRLQFRTCCCREEVFCRVRWKRSSSNPGRRPGDGRPLAEPAHRQARDERRQNLTGRPSMTSMFSGKIFSLIQCASTATSVDCFPASVHRKGPARRVRRQPQIAGIHQGQKVGDLLEKWTEETAAKSPLTCRGPAAEKLAQARQRRPQGDGVGKSGAALPEK